MSDISSNEQLANVVPALEIIQSEEKVAFEAYTAISGIGMLAPAMSGTKDELLKQVSTCQPPPGFYYEIDDEQLLAYDAYWDAHKRLGQVKLDDDHSQDLYYRSSEIPIRDPLRLPRKTLPSKAAVQGHYVNTTRLKKNDDAATNSRLGHAKGRTLAATQKLRVGEIIARDTSVLVSVNDATIYKFFPKPMTADRRGTSPQPSTTVAGAFKNEKRKSNLSFPAIPDRTLWLYAQHMMRRATQDVQDGHRLLVTSCIIPLLCSLLLQFGDSQLKVKTDMRGDSEARSGLDKRSSRRTATDSTLSSFKENREGNNSSLMVSPPHEKDTSARSLQAQRIVHDILNDFCRHEFLDAEEKVEEDEEDNKVREDNVGKCAELHSEDKEVDGDKQDKSVVGVGAATGVDHGINEIHLEAKISESAAATIQQNCAYGVGPHPPVKDLRLSSKEKELLFIARVAILCIPASLLGTETVTVASRQDEENNAFGVSGGDKAEENGKPQVMVQHAPMSRNENNDDDTTLTRKPLFKHNDNAGKRVRTYKRYAFFSRLGLDDPLVMAKFISAVRSNCIGITSCPDLAPSRTALFPFIRFAEHECRPNAVISFLDAPASHRFGVWGRHNYEGKRKVVAASSKLGMKFHALEANNVMPVPITEHAWRPSVAVLTAIRDIHPGETITIAYLPTAYNPYSVRNAELINRYNFKCFCRWCTREPDLARGFRCPQCPANLGVICPCGDGTKLSEWMCLQCGYHPTVDEINRMLDHEKMLATTKADKHVGLAKLLGDPYVHYTHSLVFKKIDEWSHRAWVDQDANMCIEYIDVLKKCLSRVLDEGDPAKAQIFEFCGKVQHALGNAHSARYEYFLAHQHRVRCGQRFTHWARLTGFMSNAKTLVDLLDSK